MSMMRKSVKMVLLLGFVTGIGSVSVAAQPVSPTGALLVGGSQRIPAFALKTNARTFKQGVRLGGRFYITPSVTMGREILLPVGASRIGGVSQQKYLNTLRRTQLLGASLSRQIARQISGIEEPGAFPGFTVSFSEKWQQFTQDTKMTAEGLAVILDAAFGRDALGAGNFVASFEEVRRLSVTPVDQAVSFEQAMKDALAQAQQVKNGFFVIRIAGNDRRPKDTLILDISYQGEDKPFRWISVNQSRDKAWKAVLAGNNGGAIILPQVFE